MILVWNLNSSGFGRFLVELVRNTFTSSQIRSHCNMIQSGLIGFTAENEPAQPHIQECPVFDFTQRAIFHVILDI
jgi:hypothetical protein